MKRRYLLFCLLFLFLLAGCGKKQDEVLHMGLNAIVLDVDPKGNTVTVADADEKTVFGTSCVLTGELEVVYCDFETQVLKVISLQDLVPGDAVTVNVYDSELKKAETGRIQAQQIQLMTQRMQ